MNLMMMLNGVAGDQEAVYLSFRLANFQFMYVQPATIIGLKELDTNGNY